MKKFILGKKLKMTQIFDETGQVRPVTLIQAGPCKVIQIKTKDKDGYQAVQLGFGQKKKLNKPLKGHLKELGNFKYLREFQSSQDLKIGDEINVSVFQEGDKVNVAGLSKGKGFAGVVKRHGFKGGPASHGQKHTLRAPGSIGSSFPERVWKGRKMAGRMGQNRVIIKGLKIIKIDTENNLMALQGAVPGNVGTLLEMIQL